MKLNQDLQEILNKHFGSEMKNLQDQAIVFSAYDLTDAEKQEIALKFPQIRDKKLTHVVDDTLIGGFILTYGSKMIDLSLRGALQSLLRKLYEE